MRAHSEPSSTLWDRLWWLPGTAILLVGAVICCLATTLLLAVVGGAIAVSGAVLLIWCVDA